MPPTILAIIWLPSCILPVQDWMINTMRSPHNHADKQYHARTRKGEFAKPSDPSHHANAACEATPWMEGSLTGYNQHGVCPSQHQRFDKLWLEAYVSAHGRLSTGLHTPGIAHELPEVGPSSCSTVPQPESFPSCSLSSAPCLQRVLHRWVSLPSLELGRVSESHRVT